MSTASILKTTLMGLTFLFSGAALAGGDSIECPAGTAKVGGPQSVQGYEACAKPDGTLHGPYVAYKDGRLVARGQRVNGFRDGTFTFYDANGTRVGQTQFTRGNYDGKRVKYFANGQVRSEEFYVKGNREGTFRTFNQDGQVIKQAEFKADRRVASR